MRRARRPPCAAPALPQQPTNANRSMPPSDKRARKRSSGSRVYWDLRVPISPSAPSAWPGPRCRASLFPGLRHSRGLGCLEFPPGAPGVGRERTGEGSPGEDPPCRAPRGWKLVGPRHPSRCMSILRHEVRAPVLEIGWFSGHPKGRGGTIYVRTWMRASGNTPSKLSGDRGQGRNRLPG